MWLLPICRSTSAREIRAFVRGCVAHRPSLAQRVILMRASTPLASQSDAALGALQVLQKPFKAGELLAVIESALSDAGAISVER